MLFILFLSALKLSSAIKYKLVTNETRRAKEWEYFLQGRWVDQWSNTKENSGGFVRRAPQFRNWITADGTPGPSGDGGFKAEAGRYHLYVSLACPWAHRTLIFRTIKGLEDLISVSIVHW